MILLISNSNKFVNQILVYDVVYKTCIKIKNYAH